MEKIKQALEACERVLSGVEDESLSVSSTLFQCLKIASLLNDVDSITWLQYECGGYPRDGNGFITTAAWIIAFENGRKAIKDEEETIFTDMAFVLKSTIRGLQSATNKFPIYGDSISSSENFIQYINKTIFTELASELEAQISEQQSDINNFLTQGAFVLGSGHSELLAVDMLTDSVTRHTKNIVLAEKRLSILKSKYYEYALKKYNELSFGNVVSNIFTSYREDVDNHFTKLSPETIYKLKAIEDKINSDNPELYSQALTTCRRLFENSANELFDKYFPNYEDKIYKTKSGMEIDITGNKYKNRLHAVIEKLQDKSVSKSLIGSSIINTLDWINNLHNLQCAGVHDSITKQDAIQCIIHTYVCLGDILNLQK